MVSVFVATSLDGFIARLDGSLDWLDAQNTKVPPGEDCGFNAFFDSVDTLILGRKSFELVLTFDPWPYKDNRVIVLTRGHLAIPMALQSQVSLSQENPQDLVHRLNSEGFHHLYVDGGLTIQGFLQAGMVDEIIITLIPVLLGSGKSLFGPLEKDISLLLLSSQSYAFGYIQNHYRVEKKITSR